MIVLPLALKGPCLGATPACWAGRPHRLAVFELVYDFKQFLLFIFFKLAFINRDVVVITDTSCICRFRHVEVSVPPSVPKDVLTQKSTHWNLKALFAKLQNTNQACQSI